ncbi:MAG TPA: GNAT family N-acetyltransferase [Blastocatellia bacterium]|nr:GNAT family N-acetyltransferase [Blastocatellia bacterium]
MPNDTNNSFRIRSATFADAAALAALTRDLLIYERDLSHAPREVNPWAASLEEVNKQLRQPNTRFFVAEKDGQVVGYLRAVIVGRTLSREELGWSGWIKDGMERLARWSFTTLMRRPRPAVQVESGYIAGTFVAAQARQIGIGRALATAAENWFSEQGLENSELHVLFHNETARSMWEELGYEPLAVGMRKKL